MYMSSEVSSTLRWIEENRHEPRYTFWTRANVGEVLPDPPSPLGWDLAWEGACVAGWRDLFVQRLGMPDHELDPRRAEMVGIFGGYAYLGASVFRVWAGRTPGMTPTTIDDVYFGDHPDVPPYVAEDWHANAQTTEVMGTWLQWATVGLNQEELEADRVESFLLREARPDLPAMSDQALFGYMVSLRPLLRRMFHQHINQSIGASVGPGILGQICTAIGQPTWAMRLMTGFGGVDSAAPAYGMWQLSRTARASKSISALFDSGVPGLYEKAKADTDPDVSAFAASFDAFLSEFGSRGANEWDLISAVWELEPASALAAIDRMRHAEDTASPLAENAAREAERHDLESKVRAALEGNDESLGAFDIAIASSRAFIPGRERSKTTIIRVLHEARMAAKELGRRLTESGRLDAPDDIFMLFVDEVDELVAGNLSNVKALVPPRTAHRAWLMTLEPPFILKGHPTPNNEWPRRGDRSVTTVAVGETIFGVPGCPGTAVGRARVILDPSDPTLLEPGDVLIAPMTDPSWTPLFVPAAAVVVDVGAALSHAVIVSRELGIPCVPSALDATRRIPDGATVSVDGDAGTVTVLALPV
jgi:rifampicin phosphotransferase